MRATRGGLLLGVGLLAACGSGAPALVADYGFQSTRTSSVGTPPGMADLGPGANAFAVDTVDGASRPVLVFPRDNGVSLSPTTGVIPSDRYSIVLLFRFDTVTGYRRILDFDNGRDDCGLYVFDGTLHFSCETGGTGAIAANTWVRVIFTRDGEGKVVGYVGNSPVLAFTDSANRAVIDAAGTLRFFRDNECSVETCGESSAGAVARIRLYDGALSAAEVAALSE